MKTLSRVQERTQGDLINRDRKPKRSRRIFIFYNQVTNGINTPLIKGSNHQKLSLSKFDGILVTITYKENKRVGSKDTNPSEKGQSLTMLYTNIKEDHEIPNGS